MDQEEFNKTKSKDQDKDTNNSQNNQPEPINKEDNAPSAMTLESSNDPKSNEGFNLLKESNKEQSSIKETSQSQWDNNKNKELNIEPTIQPSTQQQFSKPKRIMDVLAEDEMSQAASHFNDQAKQEEKISLLREEFQKFLAMKCQEIGKDFLEFQSNVSKELTQANSEDQINRKECNKTIKRIDQILSFVNVVKNSVQLNIELLHLLLSKNTVDILKKTSTLKKFVGENIELILNSWIMTNIDSDQLDSIKQSTKASQNIKNYIFQDLKKALKLLRINGQSTDLDINDIQKLNKGNLQKFSLTKMKKSVFDQVFNNRGNPCIFPKVTKLDIKHSNIEDIRIDPYFPELERLEISLSKISPENIGSLKLQRLTDLSLTGINLTNNGWNNLKKSLLNNTSLRENLEMLSLYDNKLTLFSILEDDTNDEIKKRRFPNLKVIDLEENKLSKFNGENLSMIDDLQLLNLASNNFAFMDNMESLKRCEKKVPRTLVLLQKNLFLFKLNSKEKYLDYIFKTLQIFNYPVKNLAFDYLFDRHNITLLKELSFSITIQESLRELSLSYCYLSNQDVIKLISSNSFIRLRKLDLSYNLLDDQLFKDYKVERSNNKQKLIEGNPPVSVINSFNNNNNSNVNDMKNPFEQCAKLEVLILSGNLIRGEGEDLDHLTEFIKANLVIKKIEFYNNPFDDLMGLFMKEVKKREKKIIESQEGDKKESNKMSKDNKEVAILKGILDEMAIKRDLQKNILSAFDFIMNASTSFGELKLYFKNNFSSNTAKKMKINLKALRLKKLNERTMMNLP